MSDINLKIALEAVSQLAADLKRERDEARDKVTELEGVIRALRATMREEARK